MNDFTYISPTKKLIKWAIEQEFILLPTVDPAFHPENLGRIRKFLLQRFALPGNYEKRTKGKLVLYEGSPVAYLFAKEQDVSVSIESLGVLPEYQRKGIASNLIADLEKWAREAGFKFLTAKLTPENLIGQAFFESLEFNPYRSQYFRLDRDWANSDQKQEGSLTEITPPYIIQAYQDWMKTALEQGDSWASDVIENEYPKMALRVRARHWFLNMGENTEGYLRIAGLLGRFEVYLTCNQAYWGDAVQLDWVKQALATYPSKPAGIDLFVGSGDHFDESKEVFTCAGFDPQIRPRYLIIKKLN